MRVFITQAALYRFEQTIVTCKVVERGLLPQRALPATNIIFRTTPSKMVSMMALVQCESERLRNHPLRGPSANSRSRASLGSQNRARLIESATSRVACVCRVLRKALSTTSWRMAS